MLKVNENMWALDKGSNALMEDTIIQLEVREGPARDAQGLRHLWWEEPTW